MTSRSREENREYMRDYMRERRLARKRAEYKSEAPGVHQAPGRFVSRVKAAYDPRRDPPLHHADLTALVMGDPPIGRRAIDQQQARSGIRSISLSGGQV